VMVSVCTADPILDDEENPIHYHLAGEFCPDTMVDEAGNDTPGRIDIAVLDMERETAGDAVLEDAVYFLKTLEAYGPCTVHTEAVVVPPEPYDPSIFDINFPDTWPTAEQDPNFDPGNPSTWPNVVPPVIPTQDPNTTPSVGDWDPQIPSVDITPPPAVTEPPATEVTVVPVETPAAPPAGDAPAFPGA
ncbi:MAG: hypothetical protein K2F83_06070, partial [Oscillospiraceae bacterium]|nr:hypothetical protein [Oscillospiraceae bacterium]